MLSQESALFRTSILNAFQVHQSQPVCEVIQPQFAFEHVFVDKAEMTFTMTLRGAWVMFAWNKHGYTSNQYSLVLTVYASLRPRKTLAFLALNILELKFEHSIRRFYLLNERAYWASSSTTKVGNISSAFFSLFQNNQTATLLRIRDSKVSIVSSSDIETMEASGIVIQQTFRHWILGWKSVVWYECYCIVLVMRHVAWSASLLSSTAVHCILKLFEALCCVLRPP